MSGIKPRNIAIVLERLVEPALAGQHVAEIVVSRGEARISDDLQEKLPTNPIKSASDHSVIVGFQLTADQINLNETQPDR